MTRPSSSTVCLLLAAVALLWAIGALWPRADLPAWPAVAVGVAALVGSWGRGPVLQRALASIVGLTAAGLGAAQIAILWATASFLDGSYM